MRHAILGALLLIASCHSRRGRDEAGRVDTTDVARMFPLHPDSTDSLLRTPRVISDAAVIVFWLHAADTIGDDDRADAFDQLRYYTTQVAPVLQANDISLLATRAETVYVAQPGKQRRTILLAGLDYPFGYVLVEPGGPERILTGVYPDDDLLDELRAYFDLSDDSVTTVPRATI
ncbi:MAG: hypothetical protein DMD49_09370 [Gemmatimonadetes bacterium]|nr:MAG: hypothetical protein DMD49_09370 [Gemmatimonadota bacterium]